MVRYGEIAVKGRATRTRMERLLERNIVEALRKRGIQGRAYKADARIFVEAPDQEAGEAVNALSRVFGIVSFSPVKEYRYSGLDDLVEEGVRVFAPLVRGRSFAVRARRSGREPFTSKDVERELGSRLLEAGGGRVDLESPEAMVYVEVRGRRAYFYTEIYRGPGGLPLGSEGRVLALVSGGIDSPVAAWMMAKRGAMVDMLFYNLGGPMHVKAFLNVAWILWREWLHGYDPVLHIVDFRPLAERLRREVDEGVRIVLLKRLMLRAAEAIAGEEGCLGIVTGESLGQVSSQTLHNMYAAEKPVALPVYRPLIGMDKDETTRLARIIGTYRVSERVREFCAIASARPRTRVRPEEIDVLEPRYIDDAARLAEERVRLRASEIPPEELEGFSEAGCEAPSQ